MDWLTPGRARIVTVRVAGTDLAVDTVDQHLRVILDCQISGLQSCFLLGVGHMGCPAISLTDGLPLPVGPLGHMVIFGHGLSLLILWGDPSGRRASNYPAWTSHTFPLWS